MYPILKPIIYIYIIHHSGNMEHGIRRERREKRRMSIRVQYSIFQPQEASIFFCLFD